MSTRPVGKIEPSTKPIRCGIYSRVSTDERLKQDFNSLDFQKAACRDFIRRRASDNWVSIDKVYEDGGFSGGNAERPALQRLLADVEAGKVDAVVVYKLDRFSRSILDFVTIMELLKRKGVDFVSVTEQYDTSTPGGRMYINMMINLAQFERELVAERTRDKMSAARKKGKWVGGMVPLGYSVASEGGKLAKNEKEAAQVREIFRLYLEHESLLPVVEAVNRRGWQTKTWTTNEGKLRKGIPFTKSNIHRILTNIHYAGKVRYEGKVYEGEHEEIVDEETWNHVQQVLQRNRLNGGAHARTKLGAFLSGLLRCGACGEAMIHAPSSRRNGKIYRYYACRTAHQKGRGACSTGWVPATDLEKIVVDQVRRIGKDPKVVAATVEAAGKELQRRIPALREEKKALEADLARKTKEMNRLIQLVASGDKVAEAVSSHIERLHEGIEKEQVRFREVLGEIQALESATVDEKDLKAALGLFDPVWDALLTKERIRILHLLIERVDYDPKEGKLGITFRPTGIRALAVEAAEAEG